MITVLLVLQVFVTLALIGVVLIQRSEGGGLGLGTSQGMGSFMTGRGTATLLTRTTAVLAARFLIISIAVGMVYKHGGGGGAESILNQPPAAQAPVALPGALPGPKNALPTAPAGSSGMAVPLPTLPPGPTGAAVSAGAKGQTASTGPAKPAAPATKTP
jgi:preprotein translocase subunit SecG